jgi:hypothetical protein
MVLKEKDKQYRKDLYSNQCFFFEYQSSKKMDLSRDANWIQVGNENVNSNLLKYHMALESINRIEWFQGRGMAFLWFVFNSVHQRKGIFNTGSVMAEQSRKIFFKKEGLKCYCPLYEEERRISSYTLFISNYTKSKNHCK